MLLQLLANIVKSLLLIVCLMNCKGKASYDTIELKKNTKLQYNYID